MSKKIKNNILKNHKGFTMVEMLVTITIFVAAITSATALFIAVIHSQMKSNAQRQTMQDARYAMETITREVRMATGTSSKPAIERIIGDDGKVKLVLNNIPDYGNPGVTSTKRFYLNDNYQIVVWKSGLIPTTDAITSDNIYVYEFYIENTVPSYPTRQPAVTITISTFQGDITINPDKSSSTTLRTTISSRDYNYTQ